MSVPEKFALEYALEVSQKNAATASANYRLHTELAEFEALLEGLNIEDREIVKAQKLAKYDRSKTFPRNF